MKVRDRETDIFSLSFLDIVSCAFGAVVLLLIISRPELGEEGGASNTRDLMKQIFRSRAENVQISELKDQEFLKLDGTKNRNASLAKEIEDVQSLTRTLEFRAAELAESRARIERDIKKREELAQMVDAVPETEEPEEEIGGIPVDSDYVIFVIDTSGSMRRKWTRVKRVIDDILTMHPQVKGFQIMNDEGLYLKNPRNWIKDTRLDRQQAIALTNTWAPKSDSSPYDGIVEALKVYGRDGRKLAIYAFGDDFSSNDFDAVAASISRLNTSTKTRKKLARIHGIGFGEGVANFGPVRSGGDKFALLMRSVAAENNGAYISMPD